MEIKILTFHKANNYGALLQCYALSKILSGWENNVELINIDFHKKPANFRNKIKLMLDLQRMNQFRKNQLPQQTVLYKKEDELINNLPTADCYIVGSDQVWNPQLTKEFCSLFFFSFLPHNAKRIAFAASFGINEWIYPDMQLKIKDLLSKFSFIGIRENDGVRICDQTFGVNATKTLDPTLLVDSYSDLFKPRRNTKKMTLLSYYFNKSNSYYKNLRSFAKELQLQPLSLNDQKYHAGIKSIPFVSVSRWLAEINSASFVLTNSFHCMVFAIIFKKPFVVVPANPSRMSRITNFLEDLGLENRYFESMEKLIDKYDKEVQINYVEVFEKLEKLKFDSLKFLRNSIAETAI